MFRFKYLNTVSNSVIINTLKKYHYNNYELKYIFSKNFLEINPYNKLKQNIKKIFKSGINILYYSDIILAN